MPMLSTQFFIATDEQKLLDRMLELLQGRVVFYYDCYRSENNHALQFVKSQALHNLGEDVLVKYHYVSM